MSTLLQIMPCEAVAEVHVQVGVRKECPVVEEADIGAVDIWFTTRTHTLELHALKTYLESYEGMKISHEDFARLVYRDIVGQGMDDVSVVGTWTTAQMRVIVAVPSERL